MKPSRESDGAPTPRKKINRSNRSATYANRSTKPVSYTQAAEAKTNNNETDNEPRRTLLGVGCSKVSAYAYGGLGMI